MELLEGETLRQRLSGAALNSRQVFGIAASVAEGLSAAHAKGIIYRDLKPENIFLTKGGVKILDFGLACSEPVFVSPEGFEASTVTAVRSGVLEGTIGYMSPEQLQGKPSQTASDLFALGCCLYEMISGRRPFTGMSPPMLLLQLSKERLRL
jgi:eukaryotic-like serine/threonine-protein kinase